MTNSNVVIQLAFSRALAIANAIVDAEYPRSRFYQCPARKSWLAQFFS